MSQAPPEAKPDSLTPAQQQRGMRLVYAGQSSGQVLMHLMNNSSFGTLLIVHLGGTDLQAMLPASLLLLLRGVQIPVSLKVPPEAGKGFLLTCWKLSAVALAGVLAVTFVPASGPGLCWALLGCLAVASAIHMVGGTFWFPLLHDVVPDDQRGRFFGKMRTAWTFTGLAAIYIVAALLGNDPPRWRFQVVLAGGIALFLLRIAIIARVPQPGQQGERQDYTDWRQYVRDILHRPEVRVFCVYFAVLSFFAGFLRTPLVLYMKQMGFAADGNMAAFGFASLGMVLSLMMAGVLVDRIGTRRVFLAAHVVLCSVAFAVAAVGYLPLGWAAVLMPIALTVAGGMGATAGVACTAQLFHLAPDRGRAFFMSLSMMVVTVGTGLSPVVTGLVLGAVPADRQTDVLGVPMNVFQLLLCLSGAGLLAGMVLLHWVQDVRDEGD